MPFPPYPLTPDPFTYVDGQPVWAPWLRSDVVNAVQLLTQPPCFTGTQTGVPESFTVAAGGTFQAPGTAYTLGQPVIFASGGSGFPSGLTAGRVYYAFNPAPGTFQVSTTAGAGSPYTGYGSGSGTVQATQFVTESAWTGINLDTEPGAGDTWGGHQVTSSPPFWYGMFPGYYLAEFTFPANATSGGGAVSAGLFTQEGSSPQATIGGQCAPVSGNTGEYSTVSVSKMVQFSSVGTYAGLGNNYAGAAAWQDTPNPVTPLATATRYPQMNLEWVSALAGDPTLPVPDNDAWPAPPLDVDATHVNKNIRDTIGFLSFRPVMEAYLAAGGFSLGSRTSLGATGSAIPLDTAYADNRGVFQPGGIWTAPVPGIYDVYAQVPVNARSTSLAVAAGITLASANYNGGSPFAIWGPVQAALTGSGEVNCAVMHRRVRLNQGDLIELAAFQSDSGSHAATVPSGIWQARLITTWRGK